MKWIPGGVELWGLWAMKSGGWVAAGQDGVDIEGAQSCLLVLVCDINYKKTWISVPVQTVCTCICKGNNDNFEKTSTN